MAASVARATLLVSILEDAQMARGPAPIGAVSEIESRVARLIQLDFAAGRTLNLDGWVLSLNEVRLCALAALNRA